MDPEDLLAQLDASLVVPEAAPMDAHVRADAFSAAQRAVRAETLLPMSFFLRLVTAGVELSNKGFSRLAAEVFSLAKIGMTAKQFEGAVVAAQKEAQTAKGRLMSTVQAPKQTGFGLRGGKR